LLPKTIGAPRRYIPYIGWALLAFIVLFWRLGAPSFWDPDEAHYAQTTRELIATGDWLAPYYNEQPFFDKPVLFHVLQAVPMRLLGPTELAALLVPALAALALVAVTWWLGATLVSVAVGLIAALLLTANPGVFALARYAILETLLTAFMFGGASLVAVAALGDRPRLQYGGYLLIGLAVLTKGPLAIVLCGLGFILAIVLSPDARRRLLALRWVVGLLIVLAISLPWFIYMWRRFDHAFVVGYFLNGNLRLFARPLYGGQPPWWFYFQILASGMLPWTPLVLGRLHDDLRAALRRGAADGARRAGTPDTVEVLLWAWTAAIVGFFSVSRRR
jgi:4-amino-4-deoxy-L-arabinose transferase-like glycosyltransferase